MSHSAGWRPHGFPTGGDPTVSIVRLDLEEKDGVPTMRLTHSGLTSESSRANHEGWLQILTWLQAHVEQQV